MQKIISKSNNGFTLIEILVTLGIFVVLVAMGTDYIVNALKTSRFEEEQETAISNARKAMEILTKEIRMATDSAQGEFPLQDIGDNDFTFFSDVDEDEKTEKLRYYLEYANATLYRVLTEPGDDNLYSENGATSTITSYVNNMSYDPIFQYYDNNGEITNIPGEIKLIKIILRINVTPEIAPNDYYVETSVTLRNLKDNL